MIRAYAVADVRVAERAAMALVSPGALMQRAAAALASVVGRELGSVYGRRVLLLVGGGGNGGDALWAGARLARRGARVSAVLLSPERTHAEGLQALLRAGGSARSPAEATRLLRGADVVVDGIVGIGATSGLRDDAAAVAAQVAAEGAPVVAVDLPSGIDPDTGETAGPLLRADLTVTFGVAKPGLLIDPGAAAAGRLQVVDIGLGPHLPARPDVEAFDDGDVRRLLPRPSATSDKYSRGVVGVVAGSDSYTGAAVLAVGGALHGGAGMVRYQGPSGPTSLVRARWPEAVVGEGRVQAWVAGPGVGERRGGDVGRALAADEPVVVDADGLRYLPLRFERPALLTPHAGELARLLGVRREDVEARRLHAARAAARRWQAAVLLKGSTTVVAAPDGRTRVNRTGCPWLAVAGTGDVLSGLAGALLAGGLTPLDAGSVAAHLHGRAGWIAAGRSGSPTAQDVLAALPAALRAVRGVG